MKKTILTAILAIVFCKWNLVYCSAANLPGEPPTDGFCGTNSIEVRHETKGLRTFVLNHTTECEPQLPEHPTSSICGTSAVEPCLGTPIMMAPNGDFITADASGVAVNGVLQTAESFSTYIEAEFPNTDYAKREKMVEEWSLGYFSYVPSPVLGPAIWMAPNGDVFTADGTTVTINGVAQTPESLSNYVDEKYPDIAVEERIKIVEAWSGFIYVPAETRGPICDIGPAIWMTPDGTIYTADANGVITVFPAK